MTQYNSIEFAIDGRGVATITLNRADKHNAMNAEMIEELTRAAETIAEEPDIRACILQAVGKSFCAGGDLKWMQSQMSQTRDEKMAGAVRLAKMLSALDDLPCMLIGKVQGPAYGGGIGMMAVCDIVISTPDAKFALTETRLGLIPATIGPFVLRRIGEAWARRYFFSAKPFDVHIAKEMDLVSQISEREQLDEAVEAEIQHCLKCLPGALADAKKLAKELARDPTMETQAFTASKLADRWETDEAQAAISDFFTTRK